MSFIYCHLNLHANLLIPWRFPLIHDTFTQSITETKNTYVCVCVCLVYMIFRPPIHGIFTPYPWYIEPSTNGLSNPLSMVFWIPYPWFLTRLPTVFWPLTHVILNPLPMVFWPPSPWYIEFPNHGTSNPYRWYIEPPIHDITSVSVIFSNKLTI